MRSLIRVVVVGLALVLGTAVGTACDAPKLPRKVVNITTAKTKASSKTTAQLPAKTSTNVAAALDVGGDKKRVNVRVATAPAKLARQICAAYLKTPALLGRKCCMRKDKLPSTTSCEKVIEESLRTKRVLDAGLKGCLIDLEAALDGCDWVGGVTPLPLSCRGVLRGAQQSGADCLGTWECAAGNCIDGRCSLASVTSCGGPVGAFSHQGCAAATTCVDGACTPSCHPPCHENERCHVDKCVALRAPGQVCEDDGVCVGACIEGLCAMRCGAARGATRAAITP